MIFETVITNNKTNDFNFNNLSYIEIFSCFMAIKKDYTSFLSPFFNAYKIRQYKNYIYSQKISTTKKDKLWCFLNDDISFADFINSLN